MTVEVLCSNCMYRQLCGLTCKLQFFSPFLPVESPEKNSENSSERALFVFDGIARKQAKIINEGCSCTEVGKRPVHIVTTLAASLV